MTPPRVHSDSEKVINKIRKLLNLAAEGNGATAEEAASAAAKAQELLFAHNLEMSQVSSLDPEAYEKDKFSLGKYQGNISWRRKLMNVVVRTNFARCVYVESTADVYLIGKPSNVEAVKYLYAYLSREIERLMREYCKDKGFGASGKESSAFLMGAMFAVAKRLTDEFDAKTEPTATANSRALVVTTGKELDVAVRELFGATRTGRSAGTPRHSPAFEAGVVEGRQIPIRRGIEASSPSRA